MDVVLLAVRIVVGLLFVGHGTQKLFGWFGGHGLDGTAGFMAQLGYHPPKRAATAAGLTEAGAGALLVLGLLTPLAAAMIVGTMVNAIFSVHLDKGIWSTEGGYEFPLVMALSAVLIAATGPGVFSIDAAFGARLWGGAVAILATILGLLTGAIVNSTRRFDTEVTQMSDRRKAA
jgi:putative oxidoreductase